MEHPPDLSNQARPPSGLRRVFALGVGIGVGIALASVLVFAAVTNLTNRPKKAQAWNRTAIVGRWVEPLTALPAEDGVNYYARFLIENHTDADYQMPPSESIYKVLADEKGLERDASCSWEGPVPTVLAGQKVNVGVQVRFPYTSILSYNTFGDLEKLSAFLKRREAEFKGYV